MLYRFQDFELDEQLYQLRCAGKLVEIEPRVFNVLAYLLQHHDRVVSKDELLEKLWPDQVVTEAALTRCIVAARKAVSDDGTKQQVIETQHGRGYRFVASLTTAPSVASSQEEESQKANGKNQKAKGENGQESSVESLEANGQSLASRVQSLGSEEQRRPVTDQTLDPRLSDPRPQTLDAAASRAQRSWSRRSVMLGGVLFLLGLIAVVQYLSQPSLSTQSSALRTEAALQALPLPDKPSIVVLPLVNLSNDPEQEYFSDGLTGELTSSLSQLTSLFVIARTSAFTYKGKAAKVQDIGREMGVQYVLEGSVRKTKEQIRINIQLIEAASGGHVWAERYERPLTDIFAVQDEIVQRIVTTLKLQLTLREQGYIARKRTDSLEAYDAFLRGMQYHLRFTKEDNLRARQMLEKAIELDPQYAWAYAQLSATYTRESVFRWSEDPQALEKALALAQQALALDDSLPAAHSRLSRIYVQQQQYDQAIAEGERAISLDPNNADSYVTQAEVLTLAGRPEEALHALQQAMRLNPRYPHYYITNLGWNYLLTGRYTEAIAALKEAISRNPNDISAHNHLAVSYLGQWISQQSPDTRTLEQALAAAQRVIALNDSLSWGRLTLGYVYLWRKQYEQAIAEMERTITLDPDKTWSYTGLAVTLGFMGKSEEALQIIEQALRRQPPIVDDNLANIGGVYYLAGRPEEALAPLRQYLNRYPNILGAHLTLAAVYSELGKEAEARTEAAEVLRINPNFSLEVYRQRSFRKDPVHLERHIAALRKAGLK